MPSPTSCVRSSLPWTRRSSKHGSYI